MSPMTRRDAMKMTAAAAAGLRFAGPANSLQGEPAPQALTGQALATTAFRPLPLGEIRPAGWLQRQLRIQADGLGGHLDEFWPDVGPNSGWLGGSGESWERGPYFLDGLIPLAWQLDDSRLKAKAQKFVDWTLTHQRADGMIGPTPNNDWWPRMVMVKALAQYHEATLDPRVLPALTGYFHYQLTALPQRPLQEWGKYRWQDEALVIEWLYDKTRDPLLLELIAVLARQGYDWPGSFADFKYAAETPHDHAIMETHGVNNGQGLKTAAIQYRLAGDEAARKAFFRQLSKLYEFHGMPSGIFSCDEHLAGLKPTHGTELCTVVEAMFSLEVALATFGDASIADRIEKMTFNALPGTFDDDMWAHQYDQQPNQIQVGLLSTPWTTNGPESNLYGLEPNFGCCTANFHQGWPKFTASLWMGTHDDGLAAVLYSPCEVQTKVQGTPVHILEETDYPFRGDIRIVVTPAALTRFPLSLRIPAWAESAAIKVNGTLVKNAPVKNSFARLDRSWSAGDVVEISFPMPPRVSRWYNNSVAIERGPLVFSLDPGQHWVKLRDRGLTADWQVFPTGPWNYALKVDERSAPALHIAESTVGARPFAAADTAVRIEVPGALLDTWLSQDGVAQVPPPGLAEPKSPGTVLTLIPYAAAKLRVTEFPQMKTEG